MQNKKQTIDFPFWMPKIIHDFLKKRKSFVKNIPTLLKWGAIFLFACTVLIGFLIRKHDLYVWPRLGATFDEFAWTWQGMSLLETGTPTSWSPHILYKDTKLIRYHDAYFRLVTPYLEHPPAFGIVAGGYAIINGTHDMLRLNISDIRSLSLLLGTGSIILLYFLASRLYGRGVGLIAALLYAVVPTIAVGSRIVQNENFLIPLWLLTLLITVINIQKKKALFVIAGGVLCGIAALAKVPYIAVAVSIVALYFYNKQYRNGIITLIISLLVFSLYFAYGFYYDKDLFLSLLHFQSQRYDLVYDSIFALFTKPYLVDRFYVDGWIYWGWIAFFILLVKDFKKNYVPVIALLSYFGIFIAGIPDEPGHGWYRYPFYPFLIIGIALFLKDYFAKNILLTFFFLIIVGASLLQLTAYASFGFSFLVLRVFILLLGLTLLPLFFEKKKLFTLSKIVSYILLILYIAASIWAVLIYNEQ